MASKRKTIMPAKIAIGDSVGFRPTGTEITGVRYKGTAPSLWQGFVNGDPTGHYIPIFCNRLDGLEATTIMVAVSNIETVNGKQL